jgi:hypothetical protein
MAPEQAADLVGRESGLGASTGLTLWHSTPGSLVCGWLLVCAAGFAMLIILHKKPDIFGYPAAALAAGAVMIAVGRDRRAVLGWLARYEKGYAQLLPDAPGPHVVHWASVAEVTATFRTTTSNGWSSTDFRSFSARLLAGEPTSDIAGSQWEIGHLLADALRTVGPRIIPAAIAAYESGQPSAFGLVSIDQHGITVPWLAMPVLWPGIKSIGMKNARAMRKTRIVTEVCLHISPGAPDGLPVDINISGVPNGIFLPGVIAHAAAQHGVRTWQGKAT